MPSHHCFRFADQPKEVPVEGRLDYTAIELDDEHELVVGAELFRDQLARLHLVIVEPLLVLYQVFQVLLNPVSFEVLRRNHSNITAEDVDGLLYHVGVFLVCGQVGIVQPGV